MLKYLLVVAVIAFVYYFFIKKKPLKPTQNKEAKLQSNDMVECSACGTYVEVSEAILSNGKYFCSDECIKGK